MPYHALRGASTNCIEKAVVAGSRHGDKVSLLFAAAAGLCRPRRRSAWSPEQRAIANAPDRRLGYADVHQLDRGTLPVQRADELLYGVEGVRWRWRMIHRDKYPRQVELAGALFDETAGGRWQQQGWEPRRAGQFFCD